MIVSVGLDIVELGRIRRVWRAHPQRFLERHFTAEEIGFCRELIDPVPAIAARFAAKEAFQKCWFEAHGWKDVWVERRGPKPRLAFSERLQREIGERGLAVHLSLTHGRELAAAMVVLEHP